ncbi:MAG: hypothetical protein J6L90_06410 [Clostridia bacterium]|nr:hypothetical protein [Clostridia bacterium]
MKTKSRILAILTVLVLLVMAVLTAVLPALADEPEVTEVGTWNDLLNAVNSDKTYIKLTTSITDLVPDSELPTVHRLLFNGGADYTLDLNGYDLEVYNHTNEYYSGGFAMIEVSNASSLEIKNGSIVFENYFSGHSRTAMGVVAVKDTSELVCTGVKMNNPYIGTALYATDDATVTLQGGVYTTFNGFAVFLERRANLTLDGGVLLRSEVGDALPTVYMEGYGALYSESTGTLAVNYAEFRSGVQIGTSQKAAFSIADHEVVIGTSQITAEISNASNQFDAEGEGAEYYWYGAGMTVCLYKTDGGVFSLPVRVISTTKKYPINIEGGTASVGGTPVTEATYGQTVDILAATPEAGKDFARWEANCGLDSYYASSTSFSMPPFPVTIKSVYGNETVKGLDITIGEIVVGNKAYSTPITASDNSEIVMVEWFENLILMEEDAIFKPGNSYEATVLVYPAQDYLFDGALTVTVNGGAATDKTVNAQYARVKGSLGTLPSVGFNALFNNSTAKLGIGGQIELDTALMSTMSDSFKTAFDAGEVTYQWYKNGEAIEGATEPVYNFTKDDVDAKFYATVTAGGKTAYTIDVTCSGSIYKVYLNATEAKAGGRAPLITSDTPGVTITPDTLFICKGYGQPELDMNKTVLVSGEAYLMVGMLSAIDSAVATGASVYVNGTLMVDTVDGISRFFYPFELPDADFPVFYTANGNIGIGATVSVDTDKMCTESGTFKNAYDKANPTYQTVFYQWYKDGEAIGGATDKSYTVKTSDKNSYISCTVTLVDGKYGMGAQHIITNEITVVELELPMPKNGNERIPKTDMYGAGINVTNSMWIHVLTDSTMNSGNVYVESDEYNFLITFEPKDTYNLSSDVKVFAYGNALTKSGSYYSGTVTAIHQHVYNDNVWAYDEYGCWHPCTVSGCPNPHEEWIEYTDHIGGTATCQTKGECAKCGQLYLGYHDFSNPDYQYVNDMICANFCEHCDLYVDWSYHEGGTFDCTHRAVCEICHREYGKLDEHKPVAEWSSDTNTHWHKCSVCGGEKLAEGAHADSDTNGKCDTCGADVPVPPPAHTHTFGTAWKTDQGEHWNECACGDKANKASHADPNNDGKCDTCEYQMTSGGGNTETPDDPDNTPDIPNEDKGGLGTGAIVGIAVGSVAAVGLGGFSLFWFVIKKKSFADLLLVFKK